MTSHRFFFITILIISFLIRCALVYHGGQLFNPDEYRYLFSRMVARDIQKGNYTAAITELTRDGDHQGFKFLGVLPAMVELKTGENLVIPGYFFSLFSLANIAIIWFLSLRLGADEKEALWAVVIAATSSALFYYSSHLFPFDAAMTFGLLALYVGLNSKPTIWSSVLTGILGFLAFFVYNGYWALVALVFTLHVLLCTESYYRMFLRAVFFTLGLLTPFIFMIWLSRVFGNNLWKSLVGFSTTITNGTFSEGGILPIEYLWVTERWLLIVWLLFISIALVIYPQKRPRRVIIWVGGILFIYCALAIPSVVLHKFVVYGRLSRQLVPFLALASAYGLRLAEDHKCWGRTVLVGIFVFMIAQAGLNFRRSFLIMYPAEFAKLAHKSYRDFRPPKNMTFFYTPNVIDVGHYKAYYIKYIFPLPEEVPPIEGKVLMSAENPLSSFAPFRYEDGYTPQDRALFPASLSTMMLVEATK